MFMEQHARDSDFRWRKSWKDVQGLSRTHFSTRFCTFFSFACQHRYCLLSSLLSFIWNNSSVVVGSLNAHLSLFHSHSRLLVENFPLIKLLRHWMLCVDSGSSCSVVVPVVCFYFSEAFASVKGPFSWQGKRNDWSPSPLCSVFY